MALSSLIGLRYSHARRGSRFVGLNAILSVLGIMIGIAALIVVLSVMNGVMSQVRNSVLSLTAHMSIRPLLSPTLDSNLDVSKALSSFPQITGIAPYVQGQGLVGVNGRFQGVLLQGVEPSEQGKVSTAFLKLPEETKALLAEDDFNIVLGSELVKQLNAQVGDKITIVVPQVSATAAGLLPRLKRFTLVGSFHSGNYQFDIGYSFISAQSALKLFQLEEGYTGYQIMLKDPMQAPLLREAMAKHLPHDVFVSDWSLDNGTYFNAVELEKRAMFIILSLIILVALFSLLSTMYMVVTEKRRDIAILRTMGMNRRDILMIFTTQGMIFGIIGTVLGVALGVTIALYIPELLDLLEKVSNVRLDKTMYFVDSLSAQIEPVVVYRVAGLTLGFTLLFSMVPAWIASRTQPARALSQE
ncbi:MAG: lipoprotein-releasing ABC transporter permease subunit [Cardiobacteriaceae bacterium]|nr:lipoprotein-releasing ABC transporter permease subunit [Cardiobacteriaceae bacterium]